MIKEKLSLRKQFVSYFGQEYFHWYIMELLTMIVARVRYDPMWPALSVVVNNGFISEQVNPENIKKTY